MNIKIFLSILSILSFHACNSSQYNKPQFETDNTEHKVEASNEYKVVIKDVLQTNSYTYLKADNNGTEIWLAVTKRDINKGDVYYFSKNELKMDNFESKDLQKTFDEIYFVQNLRSQPLSKSESLMVNATPVKPTLDKKEITVKTVSDGITIAELFENKDKYNGKTVKIVGQVVKFNPEIMNKNWIHLQDGTDYNNNFDLTITSQENVAVGDKIIIQGTISLNKDFGAGYKYDVIMEKASLVK